MGWRTTQNCISSDIDNLCEGEPVSRMRAASARADEGSVVPRYSDLLGNNRSGRFREFWPNLFPVESP
jgi:hypothetical protein